MPVARPELANKVPTDLGTRSIAEVNAVLEKLKGPSAKGGYIKPDDFSSLTNEERAKVVTMGRQVANDRYVAIKTLARNLVAIQISFRALRWLGLKFLTTSQAKWFARAVITAVLINRWGAWSRLSPKETHKNMPHVYPILGGLPTFIAHRDEMHDFLLETTRKTNFETFEVPVPMNCFVGLMDARDREYLLKTNPWNYPKNREDDPACFERVFAEVLGRGIFATDASEWFTARKIASHMFSGTALRSQMEHVFNHHADRVVHLLSTTAVGKTIDMQDVFQAAVFDAFCEIAFGAFPNATDSAISGVKPQFLVSFDLAQQIVSERIMLPPLSWNFARLLGMMTGVGKEGELVTHLKVINDYIYSIVDERLKEKDIEKRSDLLSLYIQYSRSQKEQFTREDYRDIIANFMIAGRDTTSCTLTYTVKYVGENPDVLKRLAEEGLFELGRSTATAQGLRSIGWDESRSIPFADAVVNEVLRLAPPVGNDFRVCAHDDVLPSGLKVRAGSRVVLLNQAIGRDPFLWKDADEFIPERWMKYDAQGIPMPLRRVDEYVHPIFFAGRRLCLGKDMARFESIVFMSKIFEKINLQPLVPKQVATVTGPVIFIKNGLPCKVSLRS